MSKGPPFTTNTVNLYFYYYSFLADGSNVTCSSKSAMTTVFQQMQAKCLEGARGVLCNSYIGTVWAGHSPALVPVHWPLSPCWPGVFCLWEGGVGSSLAVTATSLSTPTPPPGAGSLCTTDPNSEVEQAASLPIG